MFQSAVISRGSPVAGRSSERRGHAGHGHGRPPSDDRAAFQPSHVVRRVGLPRATQATHERNSAFVLRLGKRGDPTLTPLVTGLWSPRPPGSAVCATLPRARPSSSRKIALLTHCICTQHVAKNTVVRGGALPTRERQRRLCARATRRE
jgi:hypothetical protein